jgi:hypothetical protein
MLRIYKMTLLLSFLCMGFDSSSVSGSDESKEPPQEFVVKIGDKSISITEGEIIKLDGTFSNPKITVAPQPYRVFSYQGIMFKYPRFFTFEADLADPNGKIWTLSGNDLVVMFFVLSGQLTTGEFANSMIDQFGQENCTATDADAKITLGKQILSGTTIQIDVAKHKMVMNIYRIPSDEAVTKLLVIQDNLDDSGNRSDEGKQILEILKSSFTIER